uniref:Bacterial repeat domain-containing protein n=1 Tax=Thermofilum adornatum TaxID=1365176 RepID=A0A7C1GD76_9CREN
MQRKTLLASLVIIAVLASTLLYFLLQQKAPSQAPIQTQPAQPIVNATKPQQSQNATQAQPQPQPRQPAIIARIDAGKGGKVLTNGTGTTTWNSAKPFKLVLEAVPDKGYVLDHWLVNGSEAGATLRLNITVAGNTTISAVFRKVSFTARFLNVTVPVKVNATGKVYTGDFQLGFNNSLSIEVAPYGVDDAGCTPYNSTHKACLLGWLQDTKPLYVRYLRADLTQDTNFTQLIKLVKANYSAAIIDIWVGNTTIKTVAEPSKIILVPFDARYETVNGWFHIKGDDWIFNVKMPPWKKIKIYVNYTARLFQGLQMPALITVIVKNGPVFNAIGNYFGTLPLTVYTYDRQLVDLYANALQQCNYARPCMENFYDTEKDFYKYVTCYYLAWGEACTPGKVMKGPSERLEVGDWQPGDLRIEGSGEMWIKIEIAE